MNTPTLAVTEAKTHASLALTRNYRDDLGHLSNFDLFHHHHLHLSTLEPVKLILSSSLSLKTSFG